MTSAVLEALLTALITGAVVQQQQMVYFSDQFEIYVLFSDFALQSKNQQQGNNFYAVGFVLDKILLNQCLRTKYWARLTFNYLAEIFFCWCRRCSKDECLFMVRRGLGMNINLDYDQI